MSAGVNDELRRLYRLTDIELRPQGEAWGVSMTASGAEPRVSYHPEYAAAGAEMMRLCGEREAAGCMVALREYDAAGRLRLSVRDSRDLPALHARMRETRLRAEASARRLVSTREED